MSKTLFTDTYDALWARLQADDDLRSLMARGTWFKWTGGLMHRLAYEPAMCPILNLGPSGDFQLPIDHLDGQPVLPLSCQIVTKYPDCREGLLLLTAVVRAIKTAGLSHFGLDNGFDLCRFAAGRMDLYPSKEEAQPLWIGSLTVNCIFRVGTDI